MHYTLNSSWCIASDKMNFFLQLFLRNCYFIVKASTLQMLLLYAQSPSHVQFFVRPWTAAHWAPLSTGFFRQEYCSGLLFISPGDIPNPGIKPKFLASLALADRLFTIVPPGKPIIYRWCPINTHPAIILKTYRNISSREKRITNIFRPYNSALKN